MLVPTNNAAVSTLYIYLSTILKKYVFILNSESQIIVTFSTDHAYYK